MRTPDDSLTQTPTAAVLLIGNELLSGRTKDTNLSHIAQTLGRRGIRVCEARVIADIRSTIVETLNLLRHQYDYVFTTGGIGPTHDDITADCVAEAFSVELPLHEEAERRLREYWASRDLQVNAERLRMARIPTGAQLIDNPVSVAPGFQMHNVFVMAGVPRIMQAMLESVLPRLREGPQLVASTVLCNLAEGVLAAPLGELQQQYPDVDLGSYPGDPPDQPSDDPELGGFRVSLVARGLDSARVQDAAAAIAAMVEAQGGRVLARRDGEPRPS